MTSYRYHGHQMREVAADKLAAAEVVEEGGTMPKRRRPAASAESPAAVEPESSTAMVQPSLLADSQPMPQAPPRPRTVRGELWGAGLGQLRGLSQLSHQRARALMGLLLKRAGGDPARVLKVLAKAAEKPPAGDAVAWLLAAVELKQGDQQCQ